jgi:hypothetical protein
VTQFSSASSAKTGIASRASILGVQKYWSQKPYTPYTEEMTQEVTGSVLHPAAVDWS